jgi:hypothetical protein
MKCDFVVLVENIPDFFSAETLTYSTDNFFSTKLIETS